MKKRKHYKRRKNRQSDDNSVRLLILSFAILLAVIFKMITGVSTVTVLKELSTAIIGEQSYAEVISTLGKAISAGTKDNVKAVFGSKKEVENPTDEYMLPVVTEPTEETEEKAEGRNDIVPAFKKEVGVTQVEFLDNKEEYVDDTPNEAFVIPVPDGVDDNRYTIRFEYIRPCDGMVTSPFGYRVHPISKETTFHYGVDIAAAKGSPIYAFADGKVIEEGENSIFGKYLKIEHDDGFVTFYAHLSSTETAEGKKVCMGQKIGEAGETGIATGPHLHFEVRKKGKVVDPAQYIE